MTQYKKSFIDAFNGIARHKHRYKVFEDFVTMSAISLHNAINKNEVLEKEYMTIQGNYSKEELTAFAQLLGELVNLLQAEPIDILGQLYMELEISNKNAGQFFTPDSISQLMGKMIYGNEIELPPCGFVTLSEPTCGAGRNTEKYRKIQENTGKYRKNTGKNTTKIQGQAQIKNLKFG